MYWISSGQEDKPVLRLSPFEKLSDLVMQMGGFRESIRFEVGLQKEQFQVWEFRDMNQSGVAGGGIREMVEILVYLDESIPVLRAGSLYGLAQVRARIHGYLDGRRVVLNLAYPLVLARQAVDLIVE